MSTRKQSKLEVLNLINSHKELLFGKFSDTLESQDKIACWDEIAAKAKDVGLLKPTQGGKHFREVTWQNWRKRAVVSEMLYFINDVREHGTANFDQG